MGAQQSKQKENYKARQSMRTGTMGGSLNLLIRNQTVLPTEYKVKSPPLGRGPFGEIREAYHTVLKQKFLMKIIFKAQFSDFELKEIKEEYNLMKELQHPNIIGMHEFFSEDRYFYIIMDHFKGRDLYDKVKEEGGIKNEKVAVKILKQIIQSLKYLHSHKIVYRNLKLENLLYNGKQIMFHDFTMAVKMKKDEMLKDFVGSLNYVAPEVIKGEYDYRCDIWSFGVLMYTLLLGKFPFIGKDEQSIMNNILKLEPGMSSTRPLSADLINLLQSILSKDPKKRPSLEEIESHSFFSRNQDKMIKQIQIKFEKIKKSLLSFRIQHRFFLSIYLYFVNAFIGDIAGTQLIKELFTTIDTKSTGKIYQKDLRHFSKEYDIFLSDSDIKQIFESLDFAHSGKIEYEEFLAGCCDRVALLSDENLNAYFNKLVGVDVGLLSVDRLQMTFISVKRKDIENFLVDNGFPQDHDLNVDEFTKVMQSLI